jgi:hypothetical protein
VDEKGWNRGVEDRSSARQGRVMSEICVDHHSYLRSTPAAKHQEIPAWLQSKMDRMTLLVGMVGSDGIVLAADQLMSELAKSESHVDNFTHGTKLQLFEDQKLLCG